MYHPELIDLTIKKIRVVKAHHSVCCLCDSDIDIPLGSLDEEKRFRDLWIQYERDIKTFSLLFEEINCCKVCDTKKLAFHVYGKILTAYDIKGYGFGNRKYADKAYNIYRSIEYCKCSKSRL